MTRLCARSFLIGCVVVGLSIGGVLGQGTVDMGGYHDCSPGAGHIVRYKVTAKSPNTIYLVCFPRPVFKEKGRDPNDPNKPRVGDRQVVEAEGSVDACCETCGCAWTYSETTRKGEPVACFTGGRIDPGQSVTFTITAKTGQTIQIGSKTYETSADGHLNGSAPWYVTTDPDDDVEESKLGSRNDVRQIVQSGALVTQASTDNRSPYSNLCDPPENTGAIANCSTAVYYAVDDQDPSPSIVCAQPTPRSVSLTVRDATGNSQTDTYEFSNVASIPALSSWGAVTLVVALLLAGLYVVRFRV